MTTDRGTKSAGPADGPVRRTRFTVRAGSAEHRLLKSAAAASGRSMSAFILESACAAAWSVLGGRPGFAMDDADWDRFARLLDQPKNDSRELKALLSDPV